MVILAGAIVLTLNNTGIIKKASEAVNETNMAQIKQLAELGWAEAYVDHGTNIEKLTEGVEKVLTKNGLNPDGYDIDVTEKGVEIAVKIDETIIPEGGTYIVGRTYKYGPDTGFTVVADDSNATIYTKGQKFPEISTGDVYLYGEYEYRYNSHSGGTGPWEDDETLNGWGVKLIDNTKTGYGQFLSVINQKAIKSLKYTFSGCLSLVDASNIVIPDTVTNMSSTFSDCYVLTTVPKIPSSVLYMDYTFREHYSLTSVTIDANPTSYTECFYSSRSAKDITFKGTSTMLADLAKTWTMSGGNIYDEDGNLLKEKEL